MSKIKENEISSPKSFGIVFSVLFLLIELYIYFQTNDVVLYFLIFSLILLSISFLKPNILHTPNKIWYKFGIFISKITNPVILFIIFYLFFFPSSLIIKLFKGNLLNKRFDNDKKSYWEERETAINSMKDQF